jgi:uroporphyrinogen decarboxylase
MNRETLTPRERVLTTIEHKEPDRIPLDTWMSKVAQDRLCRYFHISLETDPYGRWHDGLMERFHIDIRRPEPPYIGPTLEVYPDGSWKGQLGEIRKGYGVGVAVVNPLENAICAEQILEYPYPPVEWFDFSGLPDYCKRNANFAFIAGSKFQFFTEACDLMGMDKIMISMIDAPELVHVLLHKLVDLHIERTTRWLEIAENSIDILLCADDYGGNRNLLISPAMWRKFIQPELQRVINYGHDHGMKVMLHSDGAIRAIIPDLIEMGLDIINPIEPETKGMQPAGIKHDFGKALVLHGGFSVRDLTLKSRQYVIDEVKNLIGQLSSGGGYIFTCTNHILEDIPIENVIAMYDTAYKYGFYRE